MSVPSIQVERELDIRALQTGLPLLLDEDGVTLLWSFLGRCRAQDSSRKPTGKTTHSLALHLCQVDDILGEGSDDSDSEKKKSEDHDNEQERAPKPRKPRAPGLRREQPVGVPSSGERSATGMRGPR